MVTVDLEIDSLYDGPKPGTFGHKLHRLKMFMAYRHYRRLLNLHGPDWASSGNDSLLVDVGCGPGYFLQLAEVWFPLTSMAGVEYDFRLFDTAQKQLHRTTLLTASAETLPLKSKSVDVLICLHVIEHLYTPEEFVREVARVVKPTGLFLLATPNPSGIGAKLAGQNWAGWRKDHVSLFPPEYWIDMVSSLGFRLLHVGTTGLSGLPIFRSSPLAIVNYAMLAIWGTFPWRHGEAFTGLFSRQ